MTVLLGLAGLGLMGVLVASRLLGLARYRVGWVMYLANVVLELAEKRLPLTRAQVEALFLVGAGGSMWFGGMAGWMVMALVAGYLVLVLQNLVRERRIVNSMQAVQEPLGLRGESEAATGYPAPGLHPILSLNLEGPFVARVPEYDLGVLPVGGSVRLALIIGNHSRVRGQAPVRLELDLPDSWLSEGQPTYTLPPLPSGHVERLEWTLIPREVAPAGRLNIRVTSGRFERSLVIGHAGCRQIGPGDIAYTEISRYPGARRAAFAWRGDMDLYDTASFQSVEGLENALSLGSRYAIAQTMYLSTRLSLDQEAAREWAGHYGVDRGAAEIPEFVSWLRENVALRHSCPYPAASDRRHVMELGNHGHLHYDTDTSGAPGNGWKAGARPGEGSYPWQGEDRTSFGDQRDNILEAARWCEQLLGFSPRSWAKPGRGNDESTPAAVGAAGCEVASGSDIRARDNVLRQPPPHHPAETSIVELTARYPSDPRHVQHAAMLEFWLHRGHRLGIPVIVLVHQHMRQFDGVVCERMTEHLLNKAVNDFNGDLYIDTVYGIGRYWMDALDPVSRKLEVECDEGVIRVSNNSERPQCAVPLDIHLRNGQRMTRLLDLDPGQTVSLKLGKEAAQ